MRDNDPSESADEPEWATRDLELLYDAVEDELGVDNAIGQFGITDEAIRTLAWAVPTRVDYAFEVRWSPDWVAAGHSHVWGDATGWHARCTECLQESPPSRSESDAVVWFDAHVAQQHDSG